MVVTLNQHGTFKGSLTIPNISVAVPYISSNKHVTGNLSTNNAKIGKTMCHLFKISDFPWSQYQNLNAKVFGYYVDGDNVIVELVLVDQKNRWIYLHHEDIPFFAIDLLLPGTGLLRNNVGFKYSHVVNTHALTDDSESEPFVIKCC